MSSHETEQQNLTSRNYLEKYSVFKSPVRTRISVNTQMNKLTLIFRFSEFLIKYKLLCNIKLKVLRLKDHGEHRFDPALGEV